MKKALLTIFICLALMMGGGSAGLVSAESPWAYPPWATDDIIQRTTVAKNPNVELDQFKLIGNTAYLSISGKILFYVDDMWKESFLLKDLNVKELTIYINSGGGSGSAASAIVDMIEDLKKSGIKITTEGHGLLGSAAVPIFLSGDLRITTKNTIFLIHPGTISQYGFVTDTIESLKSKEMVMKMMRDTYAKTIAKNSNLSVDDVIEMTEKDSWFTAEQAMKWGMVDELR